MSPSKLLITVAALTFVLATPGLRAEVPAEASDAPAEGLDLDAAGAQDAELAESALAEPPQAPAEAPLEAAAPPASPEAGELVGFDADTGSVLDLPEAGPGMETDPSLAGEVPVELPLDDFSGDDPLQAPVDDALGQGAEAAAADAQAAYSGPPLGAIGYDSKGRQGRIHEVVRGDTLWDISEAYLGTPWVWPSIWNDNGEIENPHLIHPGDRIWITPHEMRVVSREEAEAFLTNPPPEEPVALEIPAAPDTLEPVPAFEPVPAAMADAPPSLRSIQVSARESAGLVSPEQLAASASVVGRVPERVFLSQEDQLYIGLGEGDVEKGDQFTVFRTKEKVYDPDTGSLLGYHVEIIGWIEVEEMYPETSLASVRMSNDGIGEGDRLMPREPLPTEITVQPSPQGVEGKISFFPHRRVLMGFNDFVYLNRGSLDGLEVGSPLEVFRLGYGAHEVTRREDVEVPDRVVAQMVVVRAATEASVAVVTYTDTELKLGDRFRAAQ